MAVEMAEHWVWKKDFQKEGLKVVGRVAMLVDDLDVEVVDLRGTS